MPDTTSFLAEIKGSRVLVIGGGVTGKGVVEFLRRYSAAEIIVVDEKSSDVLGITAVTSIPAGDFLMAIASPGWRSDHPLLEELRTRQIKNYSELDFAWLAKSEIAPAQKWIGLTGTNGKTTAIQMVESILTSGGVHGIACGNVGTTVLTALLSPKPYDVLALELSSFQIHGSDLPRYEAVAILNIAEDHIDWHGSFKEYAAAKMKLLSQTETAILNLNDPEIILRSVSWRGRKVLFSLDTPQPGEIGLVENILVDRAFSIDAENAELIAELLDFTHPVPHNIMNAMAAAGLARAIGIPHPAIRMGLNAFTPDRHRLEIVAEQDGVTWVNDSKATNPHAASAALSSYLSVVWIAGGLAKGASMEALVQKMGSRIKEAILIGQDRELIRSALQTHAAHVKIHDVNNEATSQGLMEEVVTIAHSVASSGDTVLLAPACASMDQFTSYAHRGEAFTNAVRKELGL